MSISQSKYHLRCLSYPFLHALLEDFPKKMHQRCRICIADSIADISSTFNHKPLPTWGAVWHFRFTRRLKWMQLCKINTMWIVIIEKHCKSRYYYLIIVFNWLNSELILFIQILTPRIRYSSKEAQSKGLQLEVGKRRAPRLLVH